MSQKSELLHSTQFLGGKCNRYWKIWI